MCTLLLTLLAAIPTAHAQAWTFSYRGMVGASIRYEHPMAATQVFGELGASGWIIYGDDPHAGPNQSPLLLREHLKLGLDIPTGTDGWFVGPRAVGAYNWVLNQDTDGPELGAAAVAGRKWDSGDVRVHVAAGLGAHLLMRDDEQLLLPLPHLEARFGRAPRP